MSYTFVRCRADDRFPAEAWYLKIAWEDVELIDKMHAAVAKNMFMKFVIDPHMFDEKQRPKHEVADMVNPVKLAGGWVTTLHRICAEDGHALVNVVGGIRPPAKKESAVKTLEKLSWPELLADERITLVQWPLAQHYYLKSNKDRLFSPAKYDSLDEAWKVALEYVPEGQIKVEIGKYKAPKPEGD